MVHIRDAGADDAASIALIAAHGDSRADADYLQLIVALGGIIRVATDDGVIGFGAAIDVATTDTSARMITDLFVDPVGRGRGVGGALLGSLCAGRRRLMTSSSKFPAALPAYRRVGMREVGNILYLVGPGTAVTTNLAPTGAWTHGRRHFVAALQARGAVVTGDSVVDVVAGVDAEDDVMVRIRRMHTSSPIAEFERVRSLVAADALISLCVPEWSPLAEQAMGSGFGVTDNDVWCASSGVELPADLHVLDPGLG